MGDETIDKFIIAIEEIFAGMDPKTFWPLNGGQTDSYFDVVESLDMYDTLTDLAKEKSVIEIAAIMPAPDVIRLFLEHNAIIGLKVAKNLGIRQIGSKERVAYAKLLFSILAQKVKNDIFCLDGKNVLLNDEEIEERLALPNWDIPSEITNKEIASLIVHANNYCYSLFYDEFMAGGFYLHGPYSSAKHFGRGTTLIVREYHNLFPQDLWPGLERVCKTMRVEGVYRHLDLSLNFANHPVSTTSVGDKLVAYRVFVDGRKIRESEIEALIEKLVDATSKQTAKINALSDLDKVRKAAEIAYYLFKEFRETLGRDWKSPAQVEKNIEMFGEKFIEKFRYAEKPSLAHWKKLFDPRDDYY